MSQLRVWLLQTRTAAVYIGRDSSEVQGIGPFAGGGGGGGGMDAFN